MPIFSHLMQKGFIYDVNRGVRKKNWPNRTIERKKINWFVGWRRFVKKNKRRAECLWMLTSLLSWLVFSSLLSTDKRYMRMFCTGRDMNHNKRKKSCWVYLDSTPLLLILQPTHWILFLPSLIVNREVKRCQVVGIQKNQRSNTDK